ncbi:helix-turn-helix domain-containing protein [Eubacterium sp. CAG:156]|uniref:helix-turn-helix domain-containing protein n=1 Tax=Eubacterium sp. CAG:156 TaxID=1262880 RepID=UPI00033D820D|nr:dNA-binding helix-turn-helix protein [Eubacterium sp. CAG:156]DAS40589.1 MAG TPA: helix-turn-helix domain protein [Caudoviricetes sp.]
MGTINGSYSLKNIRELRRMTQAEAAMKLGISVDTLGNYERGKSYPDIPMLRKIEALYEVSYSQIIFLPLDYDKIVNMQ